jgi:hypothetical protein
MSGSTTKFEQKAGRMKRLGIDEVAQIIFMVPWFKRVDQFNNVTWKATVVKEWIEKATANISNLDLIIFKI